MPFAADAAGLGKLTVYSGLGEPLNAEIELLSASQDELSTLTAGIASSEVYAEQGLDRVAALGVIRVEVASKPDGSHVLKLVTAQPVSDPFLDMLIQVEWASGRLLREYTALLDPPGYNDQAIAAPVDTVSASPTIEMVAPSPAEPGKSVAGKEAAAAEAPAEESYKTRSGDTLHAIAAKMQPEDVSLEQMLVGLYRSNKDAFSGENMNRLKVGKILRMPTPEELQAVTQQEAAAEIRVQAADWNAYRNKLAGAVAQAEAAPEEAPSQSASGKITAPAEDKAAAEPAGPRDVVKLSKSDSGAAKDAQAKLHALEEEATARENAVKEANQRIASLEKQIQDMQKLLQVKNQTLAEIQKPAAPVAPPAEKPAEAAPPPVAEAKPEEPAAPPAAEAKPEPAKPEAEKPKKKLLKPKVQAPPPEEPGLLSDPLVAGGGAAGLLALLGGVWFYFRNKRRKGLDSFEQGILTTGGLKPNTVFGNTAGGTVDTGDTSFLTDFSQGAGSGMIDTNDVDPIAEAEVYMAYGRDVQAEEILKDALAKDPKRFELHQKLLEIYANRKDNAAFETLAGELYANLGSTDPHWAKVAEMGHKLEPDNPLYAPGTVAAGSAAPATEDFEATAMFQSPVAAADQAVESSLDFSIDAPAEITAEAPADADNSLDFDLGSLAAELPAVEAEAPAEASSLPDLSADLDLDLPAGEIVEPTAAAATESAEDAGLDFQFDLPEPAAEGTVQLDSAELAMPPAAVSEPAAAQVEDIGLDLPAMDLAPASSAEPEAAPAAVAVEDISFDLPSMALPAAESAVELPVEAPAVTELALPEAEAAAEAPSAVVEDISFDLPAAELPAAEVAEPVAAVADFDLDLPVAEPAPEAVPDAAPVSTEEEIVFDVPAEDAQPASGLDFNFDVELGDDKAEPAPAAVPAAAPDLDLSNISLDLDAPASSTEAVGEAEEITLSTSESPDVDTKLDLVTAYIDMGDTEGARELLEEVLREGGPQQRERAQGMLDTLG